VEDRLLAEQRAFGDMVRVDSVDVYRQLPHKLKLAYAWAVSETEAQWFVKADDDMVVRVDTLAHYLATTYDASMATVVGHINRGSTVPRRGKWAELEYSKTNYPPFPQGSFGHVVSRRVAYYVATHMNALFDYQGEDVSLGIWLDESPLRNQTVWGNTKFFANHGNCKDRGLWMIGHGISISMMRACFVYMDEAVHITKKMVSCCALDIQRTGRACNPPCAPVVGADSGVYNFVFDYKARCGVAHEQNIGDGIQSLVSVQHFRGISRTIDRDVAIKGAGNVFMNAWWGSFPSEPPTQETNAMPFGMHMSEHAAASLSAAWKRWFLRQDKVGIRDTKSLERASRAGLTNAYFSGCPTSILRRPTRAKQKADGGILVIDVHPSDLKYIPQDLLNRATFLTQIVHNCSVNILKAAANRLVAIAEASLVVTSRLHVAMPSLAVGTSVVFVNKHLAGGSSDRLEGLSRFLPTIHTAKAYGWFDLKAQDAEEFHKMTDGFKTLLWDSPPCTLLPGTVSPTDVSKRITIHFIETQGKYLKSTWIASSIESVFRAYPNANVNWHLAPGVRFQFEDVTNRLDILGYRVNIKTIDVEDLKNETFTSWTNGFLSTIFTKDYNKKVWFSHKSDILRYAILFKFGGVYLDTDILLLKQFPSSIIDPQGGIAKPFAGWQDSGNRNVNGAVLGAPRHDEWIKRLLWEASNIYKNPSMAIWQSVGPQLITKTARAGGVTIFKSKSFQPFAWDSDACFKRCEPREIANSTAIHLNTAVHHALSMERESTCASVLEATRVY
jgi:beta-1,3-N-acetylgalactosaminyltransferase 2